MVVVVFGVFESEHVMFCGPEVHNRALQLSGWQAICESLGESHENWVLCRGTVWHFGASQGAS